MISLAEHENNGRNGFLRNRRELLVGNFYALMGSFLQQWQEAKRTAGYATFVIAGIPNVIVLAYIANRSDNPVAITYIALGSSLMLVWTNAVFEMGWSLTGERWSGLLDVSLSSRTPVMVTMLGKALALAFFSTLTGAGAFVIILIASQHAVPILNIPFAAGSLAITMFVLICTGFIFCPITVLVGEPSGLFAMVMPFGVVCSGFLYPISLLPAALRFIARGLPTSWAMESLIMATTGSGSTGEIIGKWAVALLLAMVYLFVTQLLFRLVEWRIRVTAALSTL
ncbi:ABC transporter permease [Chloroflexota bacterium]